MKFKQSELKEFLDEKVEKYNRLEFIELDPISIPHRFTSKEDIEISGFLASTIAWGNRTMILRNANRIMNYLDDLPHDFILNHCENDLERISTVIHRTFNAADFIYFIKTIKHIYKEQNGLESIFNKYRTEDSLQPAIHQLNKTFFEMPHPARTVKHISDPLKE